jgi:hypothetical protein
VELLGEEQVQRTRWSKTAVGESRRAGEELKGQERLEVDVSHGDDALG